MTWHWWLAIAWLAGLTLVCLFFYVSFKNNERIDKALMDAFREVDDAKRFKPGQKVLCIYGHYEGEVVTVKEVRIDPENKNIGPVVYVCEAPGGEELTLSPLDILEVDEHADNNPRH